MLVELEALRQVVALANGHRDADRPGVPPRDLKIVLQSARQADVELRRA